MVAAGSVMEDGNMRAHATPANPAQVTDAQIEHMVQRFLGWRLPETFGPDAGIRFERVANAGTPYEFRHEPVGTNLFDYTEAKAMVQHMLEELPAAIGAGGQAVAVKALEWRNGYRDETVNIQQTSFGGLYQVRILDGVIWLDWPDHREAVEFSSVEAAKAAAQADFERRILSVIAHPVQPGWRDMASAPKDGTKIQVWADGYEWPEVIYYESYDNATAIEAGTPGYWRYADNLFADVAEVEEAELTSWMPIPAAPQPKGE